MKKWKDTPPNEKWMMVFIVLLVFGILLRWTAVKEGIFRGFTWLGSEKTESVSTDSPELVLPDAVPEAAPDSLSNRIT
ncbi:MAG: hypothetical protein LUD68_00260, partial [Rikenellaceae bacterium]|nr:hypothetical protein [Rikenellaceae bacterium]